MITNELMKHRGATSFIERAATTMISVETMKRRAEQMMGEDFPLVLWRGRARVLACSETGIELLVRGMRAHYTWDRIVVTWKRLLANHTLSIDELGGGHDAVGLVSLFAFMETDVLEVIPEDGLLIVKKPEDTPVHQYADMSRPTAWSAARRKRD